MMLKKHSNLISGRFIKDVVHIFDSKLIIQGLHEILELLRLIIPNQKYILHLLYLHQSINMMPDEWVPSHRKQGLGSRHGKEEEEVLVGCVTMVVIKAMSLSRALSLGHLVVGPFIVQVNYSINIVHV